MDHFYLKAILDAEEDAITVINKEKEVLYWNDAAVRTYNIKKKDIIYHKITDFFHDKDLMVLEVLESKVAVKNTYHRPRHDKHVVINASPVYNNEGNLIGAVSLERDITQIVKLNNNLEHTSKELNELRQKVFYTTEGSPFSKLKGHSRALKNTIEIAKKAARTDAPTLILGESGTGKEICARAIHEASLRKDGPFIPINCGAIPSALFESELFGYEGGAFTGADKRGKAGKIEMAEGGTLFLDEVGELPLEMQVKLLRVIQENEIHRIGDTKTRKINVRFIAATNQNLEQLIQQKEFRSDLYYRLNVIQINMPPLRDRTEDISVLSTIFLQQFASQYGTPIRKLDENAIQLLNQYDWPGNIRELKNLIQRIIILSEKPLINKKDILHYLQHGNSHQFDRNVFFPSTLPEEKESIEQKRIEETLRSVNGNKSKAARILGISRVTLYNKIKKYNI